MNKDLDKECVCKDMTTIHDSYIGRFFVCKQCGCLPTEENQRLYFDGLKKVLSLGDDCGQASFSSTRPDWKEEDAPLEVGFHIPKRYK